MKRASLIGSWRLLALEVIRDDLVVPLWRGGAQGRLIYTEDGHMAAEIMAHDRRLWAHPDVLAASMEERAEAVAEYISYAGRWALEGDVIEHHIEVCVVPNWVGMVQTRRAMRDGAHLTLSTEPMMFDGAVQVVAARWCRG